MAGKKKNAALPADSLDQRYTEQQFDNALNVVKRSNIVGTRNGALELFHSVKDGEEAFKEITAAAKDGSITAFPATVLALRGGPIYDPSGNDQAREMAARLSDFATAQSAGTMAIYQCHVAEECKQKPVTPDQALEAMTEDPHGKFSKLKYQAIPFSSATSLIAGFSDALMNANRYALERPDGTKMSIEETAEILLQKRPLETIYAEAKECLRNSQDVKYDVAFCNKTGAQLGIAEQAINHLAYDGFKFLGHAANKATAHLK